VFQAEENRWPSVIAIAANNCRDKTRSVMSERSVLFLFALFHCVEYNPFSSDSLELKESHAI
jgi:hypothetical protein